MIITENKKKELNEEQRLRKAIRRMLTEGKKADEVIYQSTGVNALRDLLANVGSIIKDKYRNLATSAKQREAFKNHLLIGWRNLLNIADISKGVEDKKAPKSLEDIELEEDIEIKIKNMKWIECLWNILFKLQSLYEIAHLCYLFWSDLNKFDIIDN